MPLGSWCVGTKLTLAPLSSLEYGRRPTSTTLFRRPSWPRGCNETACREPAKFRSWVCGIARNQAAKISRRESLAIGVIETSTFRNAEEQLLHNESERAVSAAVAALPEDHREVLVLFYREEQSIRDIAQALGVSEAAAQKRISRARDSVKESVLALLDDALPATKSAESVSAAVVACIATGLAPTAANASNAQGTSPSTSTIAKGSSTMKIAAALTAVTALAGGGAIYSYLTNSESAKAAAPGVKTKAAAKVPAPLSENDAQPSRLANAIQLRRITLAEREKRFALHKSANLAPTMPATKTSNTPLPKPRTGDRSIIKSTIATVLPLTQECYDLAQIGDPFLEGTVFVRFTISDEPEIAGLVTEAEISRRHGRFNPPNTDFEQCLEETMMSLEFTGMSRGITITYPFVFRLPEGADKGPELSRPAMQTLVEDSKDAERLVDLAGEFRKRDPALAAVACEKAVSLEPSLSHAFGCTLLACESGQQEQALAFWATASKFAFGASLVTLAIKTCSESNIQLPRP